MAITATGIGSGLDISGLVKQLVAAERAPTENRLNRQEATLQAKISAYGSLRGGLSTIESPLKRLSEYEPKMSVTNSNKEALSVTAAADAPAGRFSISVAKLATAQSLATESADAATFFGGTGATEGANTEVLANGATTATLTIKVGDGAAKDITLDASEGALTLADLRDAINDGEAGVTASIINDGDGARLVLTANETGAANTITMTANGLTPVGMDAALSIDGADGGSGKGVITQVAQDAEAVINGISITSADNVLEGAVDGLSITLLGTIEDTSPATVRVAEDKASLTSLLNEFIGGYNELINQTNSLTAYDAENQTGAVLTGDATVRSVRSMLGDSLVFLGKASSPVVIDDVDGYSVNVGDSISFASLGIVSSKTGTLSFDQTRFNRAVEVYGMENITAALKGSPAVEGIAGNFYERVTGFTDSTDGMLAARTKGLTASVKDISEQRETLDTRMISFEDSLTAQFNAMDKLVAQMKSSGDYLMSQLNSLTSYNNNN